MDTQDVRWNYVHIDTNEVMMMSGWKLYIYGNGLDDADYLADKMLSLVQAFNITTKVATRSIVKYYREKNEFAIPIVMYMTPEAISNLRLFIHFTHDILSNYDKRGYINGANHLTSILFCRYDMNKVVNPLVGVTYEEYLEHYRGDQGPYTISLTHTLSNYI